MNKHSEDKPAAIIFWYGLQSLSRKKKKKIVYSRKLKLIESTKELANKKKKTFSFSQINKSKINPATKTFQALRVYLNDELNEITVALNKSIELLKPKGRLIIVSFQSLEDRIVKDFLNYNSGKRRRSSRHYPELAEEGSISLNLITKKPIKPSVRELNENPRSRSAKLRVGEKIN